MSSNHWLSLRWLTNKKNLFYNFKSAASQLSLLCILTYPANSTFTLQGAASLTIILALRITYQGTHSMHVRLSPILDTFLCPATMSFSKAYCCLGLYLKYYFCFDVDVAFALCLALLRFALFVLLPGPWSLNSNPKLYEKEKLPEVGLNPAPSKLNRLWSNCSNYYTMTPFKQFHWDLYFSNVHSFSYIYYFQWHFSTLICSNSLNNIESVLQTHLDLINTRIWQFFSVCIGRKKCIHC